MRVSRNAFDESGFCGRCQRRTNNPISFDFRADMRTGAAIDLIDHRGAQGNTSQFQLCFANGMTLAPEARDLIIFGSPDS